MVAVAAADKVELEDRFASLIAAFGSAAALALLLVTAGGWFLVRKATEPAEASMEQMRRFMGDAAHELRTPLTVLRTHAEVALQHLGERAIAHQRLSLDDIALDAAETARAMAGQRGVEIQIEEFEEARVDGDPALLRQLVMILLDNAVKYTPSGGTVRLKVGTSDGAAVLDVADTGVGITATDLPHVFERFFRGDPARAKGGATVEAVTGAGLGLAIAKWIADAHRAVISAESVPGSGSRFTVRFVPAASAFAGGSLSSS
jgi:signal transduction histidine kinase